MPMVFGCPFFMNEFQNSKGIKGIKCKGGVLKFATAEERRDFVYPLCADSKGWTACPIAQNLIRSYEREENKGKP